MPKPSSIHFFSAQPGLWITVDKWVTEPLRLAGSGPHDDDGVAARGESPRSRGGLAVARETSHPPAGHPASPHGPPPDAPPSTRPTQPAPERHGSPLPPGSPPPG